MAARRTGACPPLLERLYGADNVITLKELLIRLSGASAAASELQHTLVGPLDHPDYATGLLANTLCVVNRGAPPLLDGFSLQQASSQMQLIHRAIEAQLQQNARSVNVLCYGYRKVRQAEAK
jgi:hypothetical protein